MSSPKNSVGRLQSAPQNNCDTNLNSTVNTNAGHNDNDVSIVKWSKMKSREPRFQSERPMPRCDIFVR